MLHILEVLDPLKNIIGHKIWYAYKIVVLKFGINICIITASTLHSRYFQKNIDLW